MPGFNTMLEEERSPLHAGESQTGLPRLTSGYPGKPELRFFSSPGLRFPSSRPAQGIQISRALALTRCDFRGLFTV
jgi:hypothetical protein